VVVELPAVGNALVKEHDVQLQPGDAFNQDALRQVGRVAEVLSQLCASRGEEPALAGSAVNDAAAEQTRMRARVMRARQSSCLRSKDRASSDARSTAPAHIVDQPTTCNDRASI